MTISSFTNRRRLGNSVLILSTIMAIMTMINPPFYMECAYHSSFAQQSYQISITTFGYSPNPLFITMGSAVVWTNNDHTPHRVTSGTGPGDPSAGTQFGSLVLAQGQKFSFIFNTPGTYNFFDSMNLNFPHGQIIVR